ncbi:MAG: hypothetical protein HY073_03745 [Deltaproteobacteria bacterium]|nr:hypothetical protein [Deltaproteobacteria bacterium]
MLKRLSLLFVLLLLLGGCRRVDLHHNLQEVEIDEILVVLHQNGIDAIKEKEVSGQDISWKISVASEEASRARQILVSNNLPKKHELGLSGVYKDKGLIPTPDEQKARFLLALKGEIINSLQKIPGVVEVDVVLNVPTEDEFAGLDPVKKRPTASVVVKTNNNELVAQVVSEAKLQRFVANTVPNLDPNDVSVIISRTETGFPANANGMPPADRPIPTLAGEPPRVQSSEESTLVQVAGLSMEPESVDRFKAYMVGLLSLLVIVSVGLLFSIVRVNRMRYKVQRAVKKEGAALAAGRPTGFLAEGQSNQGVAGTFDVGAGQKQL